MRDEYVVPVGRLLEYLGPSLESLTFYGWIDMGSDHTSCPEVNPNLLNGSLAKKKNTTLRSMALYCGIFYDWIDDEPFPEFQPSVFWPLSLLSKIMSPHLTEIKLRVEVAGPASLSRMDWTRLDEIFSKSLWRNSLKRVVVDIIQPGKYRLLGPGDLDHALPTISAVPGVSLAVESSKISELDGYV